MKNEVFNKEGKLTAYGFNCGYVEKRRTKNNEKEVQMFKEHGVYHVKVFNVSSTPGRAGCFGIVDNELLTLEAWEIFDKMSDAKKFFNSIK